MQPRRTRRAPKTTRRTTNSSSCFLRVFVTSWSRCGSSAPSFSDGSGAASGRRHCGAAGISRSTRQPRNRRKARASPAYQDGPAGRHQAGHGLSGEPVELARVHEAQPRAQPPRRRTGSRSVPSSRPLRTARFSVSVPRFCGWPAVHRDRSVKTTGASAAVGMRRLMLRHPATCCSPVAQSASIPRGTAAGVRRRQMSAALRSAAEPPCRAAGGRAAVRVALAGHPVPRSLAHGCRNPTVAPRTTANSGIADQKPITLCQLKSRALPPQTSA